MRSSTVPDTCDSEFKNLELFKDVTNLKFFESSEYFSTGNLTLSFYFIYARTELFRRAEQNQT